MRDAERQSLPPVDACGPAQDVRVCEDKDIRVFGEVAGVFEMGVGAETGLMSI